MTETTANVGAFSIEFFPPNDERLIEIRRTWDSMLAFRLNSDLPHQSPDFFHYLQDTEDALNISLLAVRAGGTRDVVGIVPLRIMPFHLGYSVGQALLVETGFPSVTILGSEPLLPESPELYYELFGNILNKYKSCSVICMQQVPTNSFLWKYIQSSPTLQRQFLVYVPQGVRNCHRIPVPPTENAYMEKMSAKRCYNLRRQEKLLSHAGNGILELVRIDKPEQLPLFFSALDRLAPDRVRKQKHDLTHSEYFSLAEKGLLLCYVLKCGEQPCALSMGLRYGPVHRIYKFYHDSALARFSPGTTLQQMLIRDVISIGGISSIDLGFGSPAYEHTSTNEIEQRGEITLFRRTFTNRLHIASHTFFSILVARIKKLRIALTT